MKYFDAISNLSESGKNGAQQMKDHFQLKFDNELSYPIKALYYQQKFYYQQLEIMGEYFSDGMYIEFGCFNRNDCTTNVNAELKPTIQTYKSFKFYASYGVNAQLQIQNKTV